MLSFGAMTRPYPVHPNKTYMATRSCSERRFFLKPSKAVNQALKFCWAVAAQKYGVELHGYCVMCNHLHPLTTDPKAQDPDFRQYAHSLIARCLNAILGRSESFFGPPNHDTMVLEDEAAQIDAYAYALANPVAAGAVEYGYQWPGLRSRPRDIGKTEIVRRPKYLFAKDGDMPEEVELTLTMLPALRDRPHAEAVQILEEAVVAEESRARAANRAKGVKYLGRRGIRKLNPFDSPTTQRKSGELNPRIKCKDPQQRKTALAQLKQHWSDYRVAFARYRQGDKDVEFPAGTYRMRVVYGVRCAPT